MSSTYSNLGIELIGTGEQAGTWGTTTNSNFSSIIDNAIVGYVKITLTTAGTSGSPNTLNVASGSASNGQKRIVEVYSASDLGGDVYLQITPATFNGYYFIRNSLAGSRSLRIFQGTYSVGNTVLLANGYDAVIRCDGAATPIVSLVLNNIQGTSFSGNAATATTATSATTATNATNTAITNDAATAVSVYPTWVTANTGNLPQKTTSASLSFVPSTGVLSATSFSGAGTGLTGTAASLTVGTAGTAATATTATSATTATNATNTAITNDAATAVSVYPTWVTANTGNLPQKTTSASLSFVPSTGVLSATGFSGPHNGTVGATTPNTGAFTTLSASSTVSGAGFSTYLASPPAIGGTAAAAGSFTTLSASSTVSGTGFSTYLASPPAIGGTAAAAGSFTTLSASSTVSGAGFSTYLASPPAIGGTAAAAITGTTITATTAFSGPLNGTVGATTPSTGDFTTLSASSTLAAGGVSTGYSLTVRSTALANAYFVDTDSGTGGMYINFLKNSASPAAGDDLVNLRFYGNDSTSVQTEYVRLTTTIADPTNASEDGTLSLLTAKAGSLQERVRYSSADGFYIVDGAFRAPDVYASTTGTAANMVMSSASGILQRSTSSLRYKNSVENATYGLAEVMQLRPVTYKGNNDGDTVFGGFIAEEVHDIGLSPFVQYDEQNRPDALAYGNMVSLLAKAMQEQQAMIEDLKARIAVLEAR